MRIKMLSVEDIQTFCEDGDQAGNLSRLQAIGGLPGVELKLKTDFKQGLTTKGDDISERRLKYGANKNPEPEANSWLDLFIESFEDTTLIVLIVSAVVSFAVGLYEDPAKGWIEVQLFCLQY